MSALVAPQVVPDAAGADHTDPPATNYTDLGPYPYWVDAIEFVSDPNRPASPLISALTTSPLTFGPNQPISRGQALRALYRYDGAPSAASLPAHGLADVAPGSSLDAALKWGAWDPDGSGPLQPIVSGILEGGVLKFKPDLEVTRAQFVNWLYQYDLRRQLMPYGGVPADDSYTAFYASGTKPFSDLASAAWADNQIFWAYDADVVAGFGDGTFHPGDDIKRGQVAQWLHDYDDRPTPTISNFTATASGTNKVTLSWDLTSSGDHAYASPFVFIEPNVGAQRARCVTGTVSSHTDNCSFDLYQTKGGPRTYTLVAPSSNGSSVRATASATVNTPTPRPGLVTNRRVHIGVFSWLAGAQQTFSWSAPVGVSDTSTNFTRVTFGNGTQTDFDALSGTTSPFTIPAPSDPNAAPPSTYTVSAAYCVNQGSGLAKICGNPVTTTYVIRGAAFDGPRVQYKTAGSTVTLTWNGSSGVTGVGDHYRIWIPGFLYTAKLGITGTSWTSPPLAAGGTYNFLLESCSGTCQASESAPLTYQTDQRSHWDAQQVLVPPSGGTAPSWTTGRSFSQDFTSVNRIDTSRHATLGSPLDVAFNHPGGSSPATRVWVDGEFSSDVGYVDVNNSNLAASTSSVIDLPQEYRWVDNDGDFAAEATDGNQFIDLGEVFQSVGIYATPFGAASPCSGPNAVGYSAKGERVIDTGRYIWFTHGGPNVTCGSDTRNHSRLFRYDTSNGDVCAVHVPGSQQQVIGIAYDSVTQRIWFTEPGLGAVSWFSPSDLSTSTGLACDNLLDYEDAGAVSQASSDNLCEGAETTDCIHRISMPTLATDPAQLTVDRTGDDPYLWVTNYTGVTLSRIPLAATASDPEIASSGDVDLFALPIESTTNRGLAYLRSFPWQVAVTEDAVYLTEYGDSQLVRFDKARAETDGTCAEVAISLSPRTAANPCFSQVAIPMVNQDLIPVHSLVVDGAANRLWFSAGDGVGFYDEHAGFVGYVNLDTWDGTQQVQGVIYQNDLPVPMPLWPYRTLRGIDVDPATGRVAIADGGGEVVILEPKSTFWPG